MKKLTHLQHCQLNVELVTAEAFAEAAQRKLDKHETDYSIIIEQLEMRLRNALAIIEAAK